jgi:hypothetical protein
VAVDDHYFETKMSEPDGADSPAARFRTLQGAMAHVEGLSPGAYESIWYQDEADDPPVEVVRYNQDGTLVDVIDDDGKSNYPLSAVPDTIEPCAMMFTLWTDPAEGDPVPYDFGFDWDGEHAAYWGCDRGDRLAPGSPSCAGTQGHAHLGQGLDGLQNVEHVAPEPVELPHHRPDPV